jgi:hypothetical protein
MKLNRTYIPLIVVCLTGLTLTFLLPTVIPSSTANSESYLFGYNNRVGLFSFVLLAAVLAILTKWQQLSLPVTDRIENISSRNDELTVRLLSLCLSITLVCSLFIYWLTRRFDGFLESSYFIDRAKHVAMGQRPYIDFEFVYGDFCLKVPVALSRLFHIGVTDGYYLFWMLCSLIGVALLWLTVRMIDLPQGGKRSVFCFLYLTTFTFLLGVGLNYNPIRYALPIAGLLVLRYLDMLPGFGARLLEHLWALGIAALLLHLSPEEGLSFLVVSIFYTTIRRWLEKRPFVVHLLLMLIYFAILVRLTATSGVFNTMKNFATGAFNLPILPAPHVLFSFGGVLLVVFYLATGTFRQRFSEGTTILALYALCMLPGSLGRCDLAHMIGYEMGAVMCSLLIMWRWAQAWRWTRIAYLIIFLAIPLASMAVASPFFGKAIMAHLYASDSSSGPINRWIEHKSTELAIKKLGPDKGLAKIQSLRQASRSVSLEPANVFPSATPVLEAPFAYIPNKLGFYVSPSIDEGFFQGLLNILTPEQVQQKITELDTHPERDLILPDNFRDQCRIDALTQQHEIQYLFQLPYRLQVKHEIHILEPICEHIEQHYTLIQAPASQTYGYGLWRRSTP